MSIDQNDKKEEMKILFYGENEIKNNIISNNNKMAFKKYYLLSKDWFEEYNQNLYSTNRNENLYKFNNKLSPQFDQKLSLFNRNTYSFYVPNNFVLVNQKLIDLLSKYFDEKNKQILNDFLFEIKIGGECIIIKDRNTNNINFISLYNENNKKYNYNNNIDFILIYNNEQEMDNGINYILANNISKYFELCKIRLDNQNSQEILDSKNRIIAQIIPNSNYYENETIKGLVNAKIFKVSNPNKTITKSKLNTGCKLKQILICLNLFKDFTEELNKYSNDYMKITKLLIDIFQNFDKDIIDSKIHSLENNLQNDIETKNLKDIISEIFDKIDLEFSKNNNKPDTRIKQLTENEAKKMLGKEYQNLSIIERLFYIKALNKITCLKLSKTSYIYEKIKWLSINIDKEGETSLFEKLTNAFKNGEIKKCNLCGWLNIEHKIEENIDYPKILIVFIEGRNFGNFSLKNKYNIMDNKEGNILYTIFCLIDNKTNSVYYKNKKSLWIKKDNNKTENISDFGERIINPNVLFFKWK